MTKTTQTTTIAAGKLTNALGELRAVAWLLQEYTGGSEVDSADLGNLGGLIQRLTDEAQRNLESLELATKRGAA